MNTLADSIKWFREGLTKSDEAYQCLEIINQLVELVAEMNYRLITAQTVAVNIAAELVRLDDMPSSQPEDYKRKLPKWILREIGEAHDSQCGRGSRLKKGCVDEIGAALTKADALLSGLKEAK